MNIKLRVKTLLSQSKKLIKKLIANRPLFISIIVFAVSLIVIWLLYQLNWEGTGLNAHTGPDVTHYYQPEKTFWDWLQLLIIPAVLAFGGFRLNQIQKEREDRAAELQKERERVAAELQAKTEREIAFDNQYEATLRAYIDKLSEILLSTIKKVLRDESR